MELTSFRIGHGYDVHRLCEDRPLILGGAEIPHNLGLLGHSDADVLIHAIIDAFFGALSLGDIGVHFPDSDEKYKGISSLVLLKEAKGQIDKYGYKIGNIDCTVVCQKPKLKDYIGHMKRTLSETLGILESQINIKATTEEELGFTGEQKGIKAYSVCLLYK